MRLKLLVICLFMMFFASAPEVLATNYGDGSDGSCTISSNININTQSCVGRGTADGINYSANSASAGQKNITVTSTPSGLDVGDEVLIIDLQAGSSIGKYELNTIASKGGTTLTMTNNLANTYDGGKVMVQRVPQYTNVTVNSSRNFYASDWDGTKGGVVAFRASGTVSVSGIIHSNYTGFRGGEGLDDGDPLQGYQGEGCNGVGAASGSANSGGGGGGYSTGCAAAGGGGGGYGTSGGTGGDWGGTPGAGGGTYGSATLSTIFLGSAGAGGAHTCGDTAGYGGDGGGIVIVYGKTIIVSGGIQTKGASGGGYAGGGGGGSIFLSGGSVTIGSSKVAATGGTGGGGANGGVGRIRILYGYLSGSSNPSASTAQQVPLAPTIGSATVISDTSIQWNFTDNAVSETGFKVYDTSNTLKTTCSTADLSSCTETGLTKGTEYTRKVVAYNGAGNSSYSATDTATTLDPPTAPTIGVPSILSISSIRWNFTDNSDNETGFRVFDGGDVQQVQCAEADINFCDETGLSTNTSHTRKVAGYNGDGNGSYSSTVTKYTLTGDPTLSFGSPTTSTVVLNAGNTSNVGAGTSGIYFDCTSASCDTGINAWVQATTDSSTGLSANTQYTFQVKARNGDSVETGYSSTSNKYTAIETPSISIDAVTTTTADLSASGVSNISSDTSGIYFDCSSASCDTGINAWLQTITDTATDLTPNVQYTFQVKGRNGDSVETSYSGSSSSYTLAAAPSAPSVGNPQTTTIDVTPNKGINSAATEMVLYKETGASCDGSGGSYIAANGSDNGATPVWQNEVAWGTVTVTGLSEFTQYSFCTKAKNGDAVETAWSSAGTTSTSESDAPSISSVDAVSGDASATYYDTTDDSSTVIAFTSTDGAGGGVDNCKWDTSDTAYDSMSNSCGSASSCTVNLSGEGSKTVYIRCQDIYSNQMSSSQQVDYTIDATDPTNLSSSNSSGSWTNSKPAVTVSTPTDVTAGMNEIRYNWDSDNLGADCSGGITTTATANLTGTLTEGSHILYMCASDNAGNVATWNGAYKWDNSNPLINITTHALTVYRAANIPAKIQGTASDAVSAVASTAVSVYNGVKYWSGAAFDSLTQVWLAATGTTTWEYTFAPSSDAQYTLQSRATDSAGNITASSTTVFTYDTTTPTVSVAAANTPNTAGAAISWRTNELTSTQVEYGTNTSYGAITSESDTSPRVSSHSIALTSLQSCTTYHYRVKGRDAAGNVLTGSDKTFTTTGCTGSSSVGTQTESTVTKAGGGTVQLQESGTTQVSLTVPANFTATDADFQVKKLDKTTVLLTTSTPTAAKQAIGNHVYQMDALSSPTERVSSFDQAITVTMNYTDNEVEGYDETTLVIYRWDGSSWYELDNCTVNTVANTVACTTSAFSTFILFGEEVQAQASTGSSGGGIDNQACTGLPPSNKAPWLYAAIPVGPDAIQLYFTDADKPVKDYMLQFGTEPGNYSYGSPNIGTYGQRVYTVTDLQPGEDYYFRITAVNDCYLSGPWSNEIRGNTLARGGVFVGQSSYESQDQVKKVVEEDMAEMVDEQQLNESMQLDQPVDVATSPPAGESKRMDFGDVIKGIKQTFGRFMKKLFGNNEAAFVESQHFLASQ